MTKCKISPSEKVGKLESTVRKDGRKKEKKKGRKDGRKKKMGKGEKA